MALRPVLRDVVPLERELPERELPEREPLARVPLDRVPLERLLRELDDEPLEPDEPDELTNRTNRTNRPTSDGIRNLPTNSISNLHF